MEGYSENGMRETFLRSSRLKDGLEIVDGVFLGNYTTAQNFNFFKEKEVSYVLNCSKDIKNFFSGRFLKTKNGLKIMKYFKILMEDTDDVKIYKMFKKGSNFVEKALDSRGNVLIHCSQGRSRSVSLLVAFLMRKKKMDLKKCMNLIDKKIDTIGHKINVNLGFKRQLMEYEKRLFRVTQNSLDFFSDLKRGRKRNKVNYNVDDSFKQGLRNFKDDEEENQMNMLEREMDSFDEFKLDEEDEKGDISEDDYNDLGMLKEETEKEENDSEKEITNIEIINVAQSEEKKEEEDKEIKKIEIIKTLEDEIIEKVEEKKNLDVDVELEEKKKKKIKQKKKKKKKKKKEEIVKKKKKKKEEKMKKKKKKKKKEKESENTKKKKKKKKESENTKKKKKKDEKKIKKRKRDNGNSSTKLKEPPKKKRKLEDKKVKKKRKKRKEKKKSTLK